jgi:excisionase family DNA binding protein
MPQVPAPNQKNRLIGLSTAAQVLGVSRWTVRRLIDTGDLPAVRLPADRGATRRRVLVDVLDVESLISRSKELE